MSDHKPGQVDPVTDEDCISASELRDEGFEVAFQRIGCSHPAQLDIGTLSEPYVRWCANPNCGAVWQETEWRKQVWPR